MTVHTVYGPDGKVVRRWRVTQAERCRILDHDGNLVADGIAGSFIEELPTTDDPPLEPFPATRPLHWTMPLGHIDPVLYDFLGIPERLTAAQRHGAVEL